MNMYLKKKKRSARVSYSFLVGLTPSISKSAASVCENLKARGKMVRIFCQYVFSESVYSSLLYATCFHIRCTLKRAACRKCLSRKNVRAEFFSRDAL